jgi:hypothetical protein
MSVLRGLIVAAVVSLCVAGGVLGCCGGVALAAGPEAPVVDSEGASGIGPFGATLEAQVNPEEQETSCVRFEYGTSAAYGSSVQCANGSLGSGTEDQAASGSVTGLRPSTEYHFRVVVENASSPAGGTVGVDQTFTTPAVLGGESFSGVEAKTATVSAQVDAGGVPTVFYVEYGPTAAYGSRTVGQTLSAGEPASATADLLGLTPESEYHFRVVTESENGDREEGADTTFRTLPAGIQGLPDGRAFEMVTPVENQNANVYAPFAFRTTAFYENRSEYGLPTRLPFQAAAGGGAVAYVAEPTAPGGNGERGFNKGDDYLATRSVDGGWAQVNLQPEGYNWFEVDRYWAFSPDLSTGILTNTSNEYLPPLTSDSPKGRVIYARSTAQGTYRPLFTTTPPDESGEGFGTFSEGVKAPRYAGASADFSRLLFEANDALSPEALNGGAGENNLYVSTTDGLNVVNILPGAMASEPDAVFGAPPLNSGEGAASPDFSHVISADGSRVFWTDLQAGSDEDHVFVRENGTSTVAVSEGAARYWDATPDGRFVLYSEGERLLRFDVEGQTREVLAGSGAEVQGVLGMSKDGDYIYFTADGSLAQGAQPGQPNLYLLHDSGSGWESPHFIATLQPGDGTSFNMRQEAAASGDWEPGLRNRTAEVTPDGHGLVFMSRASLPVVGFPHGYDNEDLGEVYSYDAGGGRLYCVSCNPGGEPPQPNFETENASYSSGEGEVAAFLPLGFQATYQPRWISEDGGRVFFDSAEPLVPQDVNGQQDAYEWERDGEGSCSEPNGCVYLLSGGTGSSASYFVDASANGSDAFVVTAAQLVPQDRNENYDLYDARVGGVNVLSTSSGCSGVGCQGASPPSSGSGPPASEVFAGPGNLAPPAVLTGAGSSKPRAKPLSRGQKLARALKACARKPRKARAACDQQARKRYGPKVKARKTGKGNASKEGGRS